jgi:hypothetical protein
MAGERLLLTRPGDLQRMFDVCRAAGPSGVSITFNTTLLPEAKSDVVMELRVLLHRRVPLKFCVSFLAQQNLFHLQNLRRETRAWRPAQPAAVRASCENPEAR